MAVQGVFWIVDDEIKMFPFGSVDAPEAVSKAGDSYNHERLWKALNSLNTGKSFDYYPRGRVVIVAREKAIIYCRPHIDDMALEKVACAFGLKEYQLKRDYSRHYHCYLDE